MSTTADPGANGAMLALDSRGFLEKLVELRTLFDDHIVNAERIVVDEQDTPQGHMLSTIMPPAPERLLGLGEDLFGASCWPVELCAAAEMGSSVFIDHCRAFLTHCEYVVRRHGLGYWLYERMDKARTAFAADRPVDELPLCIRVIDDKSLDKRFGGRDKRRFGTKRQRCEDGFEYYRMTRSMAARSVIRWGEPGMLAARVAYTLLTDGTVGGDLLLQATTPDHRFRNEGERRAHEGSLEILHTIDGLRLQADAEYEQALARGDVHVSMPSRTTDDDDLMCTSYQYFSYHVGVAEALDRARAGEGWNEEDIAHYVKAKPCVSALERRIDQRFLYDVQQLRQAVEALWDGKPKLIEELFESPQAREEEMRKPLWRNMLYLNDVAGSILGAMMRNQLMGALATHDDDLLQASFRSLDSICTMVRDIGTLAMPMLLIDENEIDYSRVDDMSLQERTQVLRHYCSIRDAAVAIWLARMPWKDEPTLRDATVELFGPSTLAFSRTVLPRLERELRLPGTVDEAC